MRISEITASNLGQINLNTGKIKSSWGRVSKEKKVPDRRYGDSEL